MPKNDYSNRNKFPINPNDINAYKRTLDSLFDSLLKFDKVDSKNFEKLSDSVNKLLQTLNTLTTNRSRKYLLDEFSYSKDNVKYLQNRLLTLVDIIDREEELLGIEKERTKEKEKQKKLDEEQKRQNRLNTRTSETLNRYNNYYNNYLNNDKRGFTDLLRNIGNYKFGNQLNTEAEIRDKVTQRVVKEYAKQGKTGSEYFNEIQQAINERVNNGLEKSGINKSANELQTAASLLNSAGELLVAGITSITKLFTRGLNKQVEIYESTFSGIATRSGMSKSAYFNAQLNTRDTLSSRGLMDNIGVSDVQEMWNSLATIGMKDTDILLNGIENAITQKIVPYLDTSTLNFNLLNSRLNGQFVKDIRGISLANQEIAGNNYLTQNLLQEIIDQVQPMSDKAIEDLALNSTESIAMLNKLMMPQSKGGAGYSESQAKAYLTNAFQLQKYRAQVLRNGSTYEKLTAIAAEQQGVNSLPGLIGIGMDTNVGVSGILPNYDTNPLVASAAAESLYGANAYDIAVAGQKAAGINSADFFADILNMTPEQLQDYNKRASTNLSSGEYNTATEMQNYLAQNIATPIATISEQIGEFGRDIVTALKTLVAAYIGGKIASSIASAFGLGGAAAGTGGLTALLGSAGPVALGIAAVGGIAAGIYTVQQKKKEEEWNGSKTRAANEAAAYAAEFPDENVNISGIISSANIGGINLEGSSNSSGALVSVINARNKGLKPSDWQTYSGIEFGTLTDQELSDNYGIKKDWGITREQEFAYALKKASKDHSWLQYNRLKLAFMKAQHPNQDYLAKMAIALLVQNKYSKNIKDVNGAFSNAISGELGITDFSDEGIKALINKYNITKAQDILNVVRDLESDDIYLNDGRYGGNGWIGYKQVNKEHLAEFNLHRQGLAKVPYDGYQAVLHAGETIMTASTTATMENMVQAFRESQNQNYRLDAAIQEQTSQLVAKIDEVINAIGSAGSSPTNFNSPSEKLRNSLRTLTNPLAFQG